MADQAFCKSCGAERDHVHCRCGVLIRAVTVWKKVRAENGCLVWTGQRNRNGYGVQCHLLAHRIAWILAHGTIPEGLGVLHHCDNPPCVALRHIFVGSQLDNLRDMASKGRGHKTGLRGEANGFSRLNATDVRRIRDLRATGLTQQEIADVLGYVTRAAVCDVLIGRCWSHVQ